MPKKIDDWEVMPALDDTPPIGPVELGDIRMEAPAEPEPEPEREQPKKRQRRGKKTPEPRQPVTPEAKAKAAKALSLGFAAMFNLAARARGDHWRLASEEASELGAAWSEALEPWLPAMAAAAPWATAIVVTYSVVEPRLTQDSAIADKERVNATPEAEQ